MWRRKVEVTSKAEFLAQIALFAGMDEDELEALAEITREYEYPERAVVVYQRDVADRLYIVRTGRLEGYALDERGNIQSQKHYLPGDYFEDIWLFTAHTYPATIKTVGPSRLMIIQSSDFLTFLEQNPQVLDKLEPTEPLSLDESLSPDESLILDELALSEEKRLGLSEPAWQEAQQSRVVVPARKFRSIKMLPDELILYQAHRSRWILYWKIFWPTMLLLLLVVLFAIFIAPHAELLTSLATELVFGIIFMITLAVVAIRYLDWRNDYFVITNRHLIHHEFSLRTFSANINKTPIDQVQSVEVDKPSLLSNILRVGTARVTTAAQQGTIYFSFIDEPSVVTKTISEVRQQVQMLDAGREQATMRTAVEKHFQVPQPYQEVADEEETEEEEAAPAPPAPRKSPWRRMRGAFASRLEEGDVVTYRKHFFVLVRQIWIPLSILIVFTVGGILLAQTAVVWAMLCGVLLLDFAWLVWRFEDWRNDTFQVTDRYVIDIDRRPFGFGESRKQAQLSEIQNIRADRPNIWATLFRYGSVHIETAGSSANIIFENVVDPNRVQSDIFKRREQFRQQQRRREGEQRRKEYAVLLDVYQQAIEQQRIPNRTRPNQPGETLGVSPDASPDLTPDQA